MWSLHRTIAVAMGHGAATHPNVNPWIFREEGSPVVTVEEDVKSTHASLWAL